MSWPDFRDAAGYSNPAHWTTADGHRYVSVSAEVPTAWKRDRNKGGHLVYRSGPYEIRRTLVSGRSRATYEVFRDGVPLSLSFTGSLADAKARAVRNAEGRDVVNVA